MYDLYYIFLIKIFFCVLDILPGKFSVFESIVAVPLIMFLSVVSLMFSTRLNESRHKGKINCKIVKRKFRKSKIEIGGL